jgi:cytochrome c oxidase subunit II
VITFFVLGFRAFLEEDTPPANAEVIEAVAYQWGYKFTHPNGARGPQLLLRVNRPVVLQLKSDDVLHALYIPAFRIQRNAVPGRTVEMWFQPTRLGTYQAFCTQYCGNGHSLMHTEVIVLEDAEYEAKLADLANIFVDPETKKPLSYAEVGRKLYETTGCAQCHSVDGSKNSGPTWLGLYKQDQAFSETTPPGFTLRATDDDAKWDAYLRESVLTPGAKVVEGYLASGMPTVFAQEFSGSPYNDKKLTAMVEYIKSLDNHGPGGKPKYYRPLPMPSPETKTEPGEEPSKEKK